MYHVFSLQINTKESIVYFGLYRYIWVYNSMCALLSPGNARARLASTLAGVENYMILHQLQLIMLERNWTKVWYSLPINRYKWLYKIHNTGNRTFTGHYGFEEEVHYALSSFQLVLKIPVTEQQMLSLFNNGPMKAVHNINMHAYLILRRESYCLNFEWSS